MLAALLLTGERVLDCFLHLQDRAAKEAQAASDAARAAAAQRLDHWLAPGIVVKVGTCQEGAPGAASQG